MKKTLKIGRTDFKRIVKNNHYFVDKTALIYDFFNNAHDILLMPRPRRFGKTLNLSMIEYFFDRNKQADKTLFSDYEIAQKQSFCEKHQNNYPVINLSLKNIKAATWDDCYDNLKVEISELYKSHDYLLQSEKLKDYDKEIFASILKRTAPKPEFRFSLRYLSHFLKKHYSEDVIILIDEYDTAIIYGYDNTPKPINRDDKDTYYAKVIDFLKTFLGAAFKGNKSLKKGLLTGIMRVGKESIFSDWNNFNVYSITSTYFADKFGFTEKETKEILDYFGLAEKYPEVKKWYDGYTFGNIDKIYNPWSIVNYIALKDDGFQPHWVNTSSDVLIRERITEPEVESSIQKLIAGDTIKKEIDENFVFADFNTDKELLWTLLTYSGYLTQVKKLSNTGEYELKIPNYEIKTVFIKIITKWLINEVRLQKGLLKTTCENLINNDLTAFEAGFKQLTGDTISYFDEAGEPEKIYHTYTLGLLAVLSDEYIIRSNRESGSGRYDILLIPHDKEKNGVVIECKQITKQKNEAKDTFNKRINKAIDEALNQINENKYYNELLENKIKPENIIKVPIVFAGKEPYISIIETEENQ